MHSLGLFRSINEIKLFLKTVGVFLPPLLSCSLDVTHSSLVISMQTMLMEACHNALISNVVRLLKRAVHRHKLQVWRPSTQTELENTQKSWIADLF